MEILKFIENTIGKQLGNVLLKLFEAVKYVAELLLVWHKSKEKKDETKQQQKQDQKIDDVVNHGTIEDLLDLKKTVVFLSLFTLLGCKTVPEPVVEATKPWENHYYTVDEFKNGTASMKLEKGESVWVLSSRTLSRLLKNYNRTEK